MFKNEKALVDKLVIDLQENFNTQYIVRELRGGNNIADIVYTTGLNRNNIVFDDYSNAYYYFREVYNKKNIKIKNIEISNTYAGKKFYRFLDDLEEQGYIKINANNITIIKKIDIATKNFIAIEAKLFNWKAGLEQALRYKQYANAVYVAISSEYIGNVDNKLLKEMNVGLMSVSKGKLKIPIKAKSEKKEKPEIQYYMADRFLKQLYGKDILC